MPFVGNDIVNLNDPNARKKSANIRFLNRVFTPNERKLIDRASVPDSAVWSIWAAKEAAYKAVSQKGAAVSSSPLRYEVDPHPGGDASAPCCEGTVVTPGGDVFFRTACGPDFVHCIAVDSPEDWGCIVWGMQRFDPVNRSGAGMPDESLLARSAAQKSIAFFYNVNEEELEIRRAGEPGANPPAAYLQGRLMTVNLSLSHDFPFVAYAFTVETDAGSLFPRKAHPIAGS